MCGQLALTNRAMLHTPKISTEPRKQRKGQRKAAGVASARRLLKDHLGWIGGFPRFTHTGEWQWMMPLEADHGKRFSKRLTPTHLSKTDRTVQKLVRDFPRALPKLVGDVNVWERRVQSLITWVKLTILEHQPLPSHLFSDGSTYSTAIRQQALRCETEHPKLVSLLSALSWVYYIDSQPLAKILHSITCNPQAYFHWQQRHLITTLQVCHLVGIEGQKTDSILHLLKEGISQVGLEENTSHETDRELKAFVFWLTQQDSGIRKHAVKFVTLASSTSREFAITELFTTIQALVLLPSQLQSAIARTITLLPSQPALRLGFLIHFQNLSTESTRTLVHFLSGFQEYVTASNDTKALTPWGNIAQYRWSNPDRFLLHNVKPTSMIPDVFRLLSQIHDREERGLDDEEVENLWPLMKLGFTEEWTLAIALRLRKSNLLEHSV